jgi:long-chain acyl-CoA synthetase
MHMVLNLKFDHSDTWLHAAPMFHLADAWACFAVTLVGGKHVHIREFVPANVLQTIQDEKITRTILVPTMINFLVNTPNVREYDTSSMKTLMYGASPMPVDRLRAAIDVFGPILAQGYGMTETSPLLTVLASEDHVTEGAEHLVERLSACGREIPGVEVRVVDPSGNEVKPGEVGEIVARGPNIMLGYWKLPEATAAAIVDGWMHTGDLATVDDENYIFIVDRKKDMIITGGENVFSTEVEDVLYMHPAILEAAVIGVPDEKWGEAVKAVVVLKEGQQASDGEIIEFVRANIAHYKSPRSVDFASSLPKTGSGKIQKSEIRKQYWEGFERRVN